MAVQQSALGRPLKSYNTLLLWFILNFLLLSPILVSGTPFYYGTYRSYGTGDTIISTSHANGGPMTALSKWQVECLDGEAAIGILDNVFDYGGITQLWCKFVFPYKVSTRNVYPYYQYCHVRNYTQDFFCYDPRNHETTANSFITGLYDSEGSFWVYRQGVDRDNPYKCCKTPPGYYIDYVSCYYVWTHDQYWEYYDSQFFLLNCASGYILTGISKKFNPITPLEWRLEWLQCCRVGYGAIVSLPPPIIATPKGGPVAYSSSSAITPTDIPADYQAQYRGKRSTDTHTALHTKRHAILTEEEPLGADGPALRSPFLEGHGHAAGSTSNGSGTSGETLSAGTEEKKAQIVIESM